MNTPIPVEKWRAMKAKGKAHSTTMNRTEAGYAERLGLDTNVVWFKFGAVTLKLADDCRYSPDFIVMLASGEIEMHEVKGFRREDAMVKIRVAASVFPFRFVLVEREKGEWKFTEIKACA